jgi:hypothetical protein
VLAARRRSAAAVIVTALVVTVVVFAALAVTQPPASAETTAVLTVFTGTAEIQKSHSGVFTRAQTGDQVSGGDAVRTGDETKAAITYPSGTVARLDSNTRLTISQFGRTTGGGWNIAVFQAVGKSWSRMSHLVGGSSYVVNAPNSVAAEVRGTEFEVIVETHGGSTVVRLDVFAGVVAATANRGSVSVSSGQSTTTAPGLPPSAPDAITTADRQDSFTVFNETADASRGKPVSVNTNRFASTETSGVVTGRTGDGSTDLQFTLGWPGSRFELTVFDPAGSVYADVSSAVSPVTIVVADAQAGFWSYQVTDVESKPGEVWWVIVSEIPDATAQPPAGGSSSTTTSGLAPAAPGGAPHSKPSQATAYPPASSSASSSVTPVVAAVAAPLTPVVAAVAPVTTPLTPVVAAVAAPLTPVVAAIAPVTAPLTPVVAAVAPVLAPVTPVVAAVAAPLAPVLAAVAPVTAPLTPVVAAVAPLLAPAAPVVAVVSPLLAPVPAAAPLLAATPGPSPPPPSPPAAPPPPPPPTPAPAGLLSGLLGVVASAVP